MSPITHYTAAAGGPWRRWYLGDPINIRRISPDTVELFGDSGFSAHVHALKFENGQEWDAVNGDRLIVRLH